MISFLNPWLWLGALAVAAPVWLHLRRKQETNVVRFSALRFLDDSPWPRRSPLRLRDLVLFALRLLALLLVVAAFAWPYRREAISNPVEESRVYILDNTLSHQSNNGFAKDRDRIAEEISRLARGVQAAVIELTSEPRIVVAFSDDRVAARRKVEQLIASHQRGSYVAAFRQANTLLANSLGQRKRIVFYSDNQENQWSENLNSPPFLQNVETEIASASVGGAPNLSLSEPKLQRVFLGDQALLNWSAKLTHLGAAHSCQVTLRVNNQILLDRALDLPEQPETLVLQAQWEADPKEWMQGEAAVTGTPDALSADNRVYFSLPPVTEGKVALLAQSTYLRLALSPEVMRGHWKTRVLDPTQLAAELSSSSSPDVLCLESYYLQSSDARKLVWRYLTNGRGVVLFVNRVSPVIAGALRELGFEGQSAPASGAADAQGFGYIAYSHPVFHPFRSADYGNLMEVRVSRYSRVKSKDSLPLVVSKSGDPLVFEGTKFSGRLLVTAFGFDRDETTWATHLTFVPFLDLCLQHTRAQSAAPTDFEPGQVATIDLPADSPVRSVVLRQAKLELQRIPASGARVQIRLPDRPGLYSLTYDDAVEPSRVLSVNPSPKESELKYAESPVALKVWRLGAGEKRKEPPLAARKLDLSLSAIRQQQFWWWLLVAALVALTLETACASLRKEPR